MRSPMKHITNFMKRYYMEEFNNSPEPLISFRDADIMNTESTVIYGLNIDVYQGDLVYIVGKVGTGKTSIIRTLIA